MSKWPEALGFCIGFGGSALLARFAYRRWVRGAAGSWGRSERRKR